MLQPALNSKTIFSGLVMIVVTLMMVHGYKTSSYFGPNQLSA